MTQLINVPLESYLLAQRAAPISCYLCGADNCSQGERCCRCHAPLAISRLPPRQRQATRLIAVVGAPGAGKTVYLGLLLDMLARRVGGLRSEARGPFSLALQQQTTTALAAGCYPEKTDARPELWHWVHCQVQCSRTRAARELVLADIAGEAWVREADHPGAYPAIGSLLSKCHGVVVLADAQRLHAGEHSDDYVTLKLLSLLAELRGGRAGKRARPDRRPLALVFTKGDACPSCLDDPRAFAEAHASALLLDCQTRMPNTRTFATSAVGASAPRSTGSGRRDAPLRVEPQGVVEPFGWLLANLP